MRKSLYFAGVLPLTADNEIDQNGPRKKYEIDPNFCVGERVPNRP